MDQIRLGSHLAVELLSYQINRTKVVALFVYPEQCSPARMLLKLTLLLMYIIILCIITIDTG